MPASSRPDPDVLLAAANREESSARRGRLKVFFGMAPGVGKTYAMLNAAQRLARDGVDVVAGIVETHGRVETEQILLGLDILPRRIVEYRPAGAADATPTVKLAEFDLAAALARKPELLLIDELAHTNAPGSTNEKRYQDVRACLDAGINVLTTLNVQHIESLHDVIHQITGVDVRETVPDSVIEQADEIELVDLPPDALLDRLKAGKVYLAESARAATDADSGFFRKGNLTALRELALRRTAQWVDAQMRTYKDGRHIAAMWPATERLLVAVSPSPMSSKVVRAAKRMAAGLHADIIAVYVEPAGTGPSPADRERVLATLRLAEQLDAQTVTLGPSATPAKEVLALARSRNVSKIVAGKTGRARWHEAIFGSFVGDLIRESGDIDIYVIRGDSDAPAESPGATRAESGPARIMPFVWAVSIVLFCTAVASLLPARLDIANVAMLFLACVVVCAVWLGRAPAVLAAVLGVGAFDFFFVPPRLTLAVSDVQYLITFAVMLAVGLLIASLTTRLRTLADAARDRERRTAALYAITRELATARSASAVAAIACAHLRDTFSADVAVLSTRAPQLDVLGSSGSPDWLTGDPAGRAASVARWTLDHGKPAGIGTSTLPQAAGGGRFVPLIASQGRVGALALRPADPVAFLAPAQILLLDALAGQIALAIERIGLVEGQQVAKVEAQTERIRSALLSSVSHDLRTPLATIAGAAGALRESRTTLDDATASALADSIVSEARRLGDLVANLLFATRLESPGQIELHREWTTVEELVGIGLAPHRAALASRPLRIGNLSELPMLRVDNAMLPQVIVNLVENALRYSPAGSPISITAWTADQNLVVRIADEGPGLADDEAQKVFQRFYRGRVATGPHRGSTPGEHHASPGMGLGLTICQGIIAAHGGRIWAEPNKPNGAAFLFSLPVEFPQPAMPPEVPG